MVIWFTFLTFGSVSSINRRDVIVGREVRYGRERSICICYASGGLVGQRLPPSFGSASDCSPNCSGRLRRVRAERPYPFLKVTQ